MKRTILQIANMANIGRTALLAVSIWLGSDLLALAKGETTAPNSGHEEVLKYRQEQNILPFEEILAAVKSRIAGEIIEVEFEVEDGIPVYEIKYIDKRGHVLETYIDGRTGVVIKEERD